MADRKIDRVKQGFPLLPGANQTTEGYNFALELPYGTEASLVLYRKMSKTPAQEIVFSEEFRTANAAAVLIPDFPAKDYEYNFRINGRIVLDPWAYSIHGRDVFGVVEETADEHRVRCGFLSKEKYDWEGDQAPAIPYEDLILYKVHVRGYTKQYKLPARLKGTFRGLEEMIPYWKELGINALELMPPYEFSELPGKTEDDGMVSRKNAQDRVNYWGYLPGCYLAVKRSYCAGKEPEKEFRDLVKALHRAGIECIVEMYFPAGTSVVMLQRILWFWKIYYHVDGFHLVGEGIPSQGLSCDGILAETKLFFQNISDTEIGDAVRTPYRRHLAEYNYSFMQDMRRFLKSDEDMLGSAVHHIRHNSCAYGTVNFMACQDGFTLADAVSYNYKHNEANGQDNRDGSSYNYSWNCGVEGPSRKTATRQMRIRQAANAFLMVLLSQGTPMIYGGDEFGNSQNGNNNAWCQDNAIGWTDWKCLKKNERLYDFVRKAVAFRKAHPILHMPGELQGTDYLAKGFPDISFHGERAWYLSYENTSRLLGVMYCGLYAEKTDGKPDDFIYVAYNFHWENRALALPNLPEGMRWEKIADTGNLTADTFCRTDGEAYEKAVEVGPRSIVVLLGCQEE